ncbi:hypothetical protein GCM10009676_10140 [Prauserella halophila]|uniref:Uncharacterized protein n=2 Tax=Prauserella halophila TaxID=185641 RepID=A0ABP4GLW1_9PSEU
MIRPHRGPGEEYPPVAPMVTPAHRTPDYPNAETTPMLHEEMARDRLRELRKQAEFGRVARRERAARRWQRVARWASHRAAHFEP